MAGTPYNGQVFESPHTLCPFRNGPCVSSCAFFRVDDLDDETAEDAEAASETSADVDTAGESATEVAPNHPPASDSPPAPVEAAPEASEGDEEDEQDSVFGGCMLADGVELGIDSIVEVRTALADVQGIVSGLDALPIPDSAPVWIRAITKVLPAVAKGKSMNEVAVVALPLIAEFMDNLEKVRRERAARAAAVAAVAGSTPAKPSAPAPAKPVTPAATSPAPAPIKAPLRIGSRIWRDK